MPSAIVEVQYVNRPQPGKKMGSVKDAEGNYYGVSPGMLGMFQQGGVYEIFFEDREFQGKTYHTVKTVKAHESKTAPAAAKVLGDVQRARTNEADAQRMWVCALLGHAIQVGAVDIWTVTALAEVGRNFLKAHKLIFSDEEIPEAKANGPQAKQPLNEEMGDDIPY